MCRYTRVKQDNAALTARIHMLEEHIRELEVPFCGFLHFLIFQADRLRTKNGPPILMTMIR